MSQAKTSLPQLPGGPGPDAPIPRDRVHGVDVRTCGMIAGRISRVPAKRAAVLGEHGLNEASWIEVERTWMLRVAAALLAVDLSLRGEYDEGFAAASTGEAAPEFDLERYAGVVAEIEAGDPPAEVLARAGISLGAWSSIQRAWAGRVTADPQLAAELRRRVAARRASRKSGGGGGALPPSPGADSR
ncbi:MAG TPA: hypothetical protein VFF45_00805 [Bacilli bacterium]|nr:hypothetical protein [Bacilli bacterium]